MTLLNNTYLFRLKANSLFTLFINFLTERMALIHHISLFVSIFATCTASFLPTFGKKLPGEDPEVHMNTVSK